MSAQKEAATEGLEIHTRATPAASPVSAANTKKPAIVASLARGLALRPSPSMFGEPSVFTLG